MTHELTTSIDPGRAFEALRAEVSLLRRGIEGLTAERHSSPDYGPTLEQMNAHFQELVRWARKVNERPAMRLTPEHLEQEIARIAVDARTRDREIIELADARMSKAVAGIERVTESASDAFEQWRAMCLVGGITFLAGMLMVLALQALPGILAA